MAIKGLGLEQDIHVVNTFVHYRQEADSDSEEDSRRTSRRLKTEPNCKVGRDASEQEEDNDEETEDTPDSPPKSPCATASTSRSELDRHDDDDSGVTSPVVSIRNTFVHVSDGRDRQSKFPMRSKTLPARELEADVEAADLGEEEEVGEQPVVSHDTTFDFLESNSAVDPRRITQEEVPWCPAQAQPRQHHGALTVPPLVPPLAMPMFMMQPVFMMQPASPSVPFPEGPQPEFEQKNAASPS
ncbi:unnamed protein product, partial [Polarella glacialis]